VPVSKTTKKVDYSATSLISDDIVYLPWVSSFFKVFLKADGVEQAPPAGSVWDPWTPFSSKWALNVPFAQLVVEFRFTEEL
jgi:hypothetical protein